MTQTASPTSPHRHRPPLRFATRLLLAALLAPLIAGPQPAFAVAAEGQPTPAPTAASPPHPPTQPTTGPGGADYRFAAVDARRVGIPPDGYWLFSPADERAGHAAAGTASLPVVIFLHGVGALDPTDYRGWIDHLVRRGAYVVYPDFHPTNPLAAPWPSFVDNLSRAVLDARARLGDGAGSEPPPDWSRLAVVGHSLGGVMAVAYAAAAADSATALPQPSVVVAVQPGGCRGCGGLTNEGGVPLVDLAAVGPQSRILVIAADADAVVGDRPARLIWRALTGVPLDRRAYVLLRSDRHGDPALVADHLLAQTGGPGSRTDALDWYGTWKLVDLATDCAYSGRPCADPLGNRAAQQRMGTWSDGVPVAPALVGNDPASLPTPPATPATPDA